MENSFHLFNVPIVSPELNQEDTILQIADSLDYLSTVASTIFNCILVGVSKQNERLQNINARADIAKAKIDKLTGSKCATKVFSSAKYPAEEAYVRPTSLFVNVKILDQPHKKEVDGPKKHDTQHINEKLQFFHVRSKAKLLKKNVDIATNCGLGPIPSNLDSIGSLLLFNTTEIPYKNYVSMDPMKVAGKTKHEEKETTKKLDAAPQSIASGEQLSALTPENYLYSPSLGDVPVLDVPMDLPDLPGVADDLRYDLGHGPGFAPSVVTTPAMPDLPSIIPELPEIAPDNSKKYERNDPVVPSFPPPPMQPPPLPPQATPTPPVPPPPPPPPPPPQLSFDLPPADFNMPADNVEKLKKPKAASNDARINLMDAIRKAGGTTSAKLKSVRVNQDELRRKNEENAIAAGGDLMADLHNRLLMRRKGISGDKTGSGSVMDKLSAMIPPPQAHQDTSSATEEDDWD